MLVCHLGSHTAHLRAFANWRRGNADNDGGEDGGDSHDKKKIILYLPLR